jgi:hypothetical protein
MTGVGRVRVSLVAGELEIEGDEEFVAKYEADLKDILRRLKEQPVPQPVGGKVGVRPSGGAVGTGTAKEFGEAIHSLPKGSSGTDQILVAGYYAATGSTDGTFATSEANSLLVEQGIKLSNPSQALKNGLAAKRVFKVGKRFKLSKTGDDSIRSFIGA